MNRKMMKLLLISMLVLLVGTAGTVHAQQPIPMLQNLTQLSSNQLKITYDREVDQVKGTTASNYWIQSLSEEIPTGIATLGKNDQIAPANALNASQVMIQPTDGSNKSFLLTFSQPITTGKPYKMTICYSPFRAALPIAATTDLSHSQGNEIELPNQSAQGPSGSSFRFYLFLTPSWLWSYTGVLLLHMNKAPLTSGVQNVYHRKFLSRGLVEDSNLLSLLIIITIEFIK